MLDGDEASSHLDMFSLEMFENIAYIMAKHADPSIPDSPERRMNITVQMYPCSEGTDTGNPVL